MQIFITIIATLLVFTALVVAHEFGHYIVAKKRGIKVIEFAIGWGPKILKWGKGETEFTWRALPIGGFCKFADDVEKEPEPGDFREASVASRALTVVAGPVMNIILALVLTAVYLMNIGGIMLSISKLQPDMPAIEAGLQEGDVIHSMNGVAIDFELEYSDYMMSEKGDSIPVVVERDGKKLTFDVPTVEVDGQPRIGIEISSQPKSFNFFEATGLSFRWISLKIQETFGVLGGAIFQGEGTENISGAVGAAVVIGQAAQSARMDILWVAALISVSLAIFNLLPIPALDGGKLVMLLIEKIRKKPVSENLEGILNLIGFGLLIALAIFLVFQDIGRFF